MTDEQTHNIVPAIAMHAEPIDDVQPHPDNARVGDIEFVAGSLTEHGQYRVAVVDDDGHIAVGNHMWHAAKQLGWTHLAVIRPGLDQAQARRLRIADNRAHDRGRYNEKLLLAELNEIIASDADRQGVAFESVDAQLALSAVGYDDAALRELRKITEGKPVADAPAAFPDPEAGMTTDYCCPNCGYEWSGNPTGGNAGNQPTLPDATEEV